MSEHNAGYFVCDTCTSKAALLQNIKDQVYKTKPGDSEFENAAVRGSCGIHTLKYRMMSDSDEMKHDYLTRLFQDESRAKIYIVEFVWPVPSIAKKKITDNRTRKRVASIDSDSDEEKEEALLHSYVIACKTQEIWDMLYKNLYENKVQSEKDARGRAWERQPKTPVFSLDFLSKQLNKMNM